MTRKLAPSLCCSLGLLKTAEPSSVCTTTAPSSYVPPVLKPSPKSPDPVPFSLMRTFPCGLSVILTRFITSAGLIPSSSRSLPAPITPVPLLCR